MSGALLGSYQPGGTWLHRLPASAKLWGLLVLGVVVVAVRGPVSTMLFLAGALGLVAWSGAGLRLFLGALRGILVVVVLLGAYQAWQHGWPRAVESVGDLVALVLLATVLTVTTRIDEVLDAITRGLHPFARLGVDPEKVALAFSLMLRAIPTTIEIADQTRDAAVARGLQRSLRARLTPVVIRVVAHARATGDALHARGIGDDA
ncbi:energy-coupling factor transporter transmembrane component T family protein [Nocardioides donggukensis]|uniref:Energy-coupling factor transporter transmembrane protein EcfT n=1 Tax=Nocardioides donggukensis TaxID=2774019 RepID=A0A927K2Q1_9ACTN|nr:energy-coupling factor transporter transmembrane component T [Nocardioides donggukensis]MBD8868984.1 energy-coupling factor transporter transmembrane protein EcfT [Nocardioides donggukensis]